MNEAGNPYSTPVADIPKVRPTAVNIALLLIGMEILLSIIAIIASLDGVNTGMKSGLDVLSNMIYAALVVVSGIFVARGRNWARITLLILWAISLLPIESLFHVSIISLRPSFAHMYWFPNSIYLVFSLVLMLTTIILLFGAGRSWFGKREQ